MTTILDSALTMPRTCVAADQVIALDSVGSTNTYAAELVRKGALFGSASRDGLDGCDGRDWTGREIVAICADEQTAVSTINGPARWGSRSSSPWWSACLRRLCGTRPSTAGCR